MNEDGINCSAGTLSVVSLFSGPDHTLNIFYAYVPESILQGTAAPPSTPASSAQTLHTSPYIFNYHSPSSFAFWKLIKVSSLLVAFIPFSLLLVFSPVLLLYYYVNEIFRKKRHKSMY